MCLNVFHQPETIQFAKFSRHFSIFVLYWFVLCLSYLFDLLQFDSMDIRTANTFGVAVQGLNLVLKHLFPEPGTRYFMKVTTISILILC